MTPSKLHSGRGVMWLALAGWGLVAIVGQAGCADSQPNASILLPDGGPAGGGGTGAGGFLGAGGLPASRGAAGLDGSAGAAGAAGAPPAPPVTFTQIYQDILSVSCTGSQCHKPGSQAGVSFASQASAYKALSMRVIAGDAEGSGFYVLVDTGQMPPTQNLSAAQLAEIASWIDAGAMND